MANRNDYEPEEWEDMCDRFADPGGDSALHRSSSRNPRDRSCPTCGRENMLTRKDVAAGYQCDDCARRDEMGGW